MPHQGERRKGSLKVVLWPLNALCGMVMIHLKTKETRNRINISEELYVTQCRTVAI